MVTLYRLYFRSDYTIFVSWYHGAAGKLLTHWLVPDQPNLTKPIGRYWNVRHRADSSLGSRSFSVRSPVRVPWRVVSRENRVKRQRHLCHMPRVFGDTVKPFRNIETIKSCHRLAGMAFNTYNITHCIPDSACIACIVFDPVDRHSWHDLQFIWTKSGGGGSWVFSF